MTRQESPIARTGRSVQERQLRSALHQILHQHGLMHGSLIVRQRVCGKPTCRCARGQLHESLYLVVTEAGKGRQMYVPQRCAALVRQWLGHYVQARRLLEDLSRLHWHKIRQRQE